MRSQMTHVRRATTEYPYPSCRFDSQRIRGQLHNPALIVMLEVFSEPTKVSIVLEELNGEKGRLFL